MPPLSTLCSALYEDVEDISITSTCHPSMMGVVDFDHIDLQDRVVVVVKKDKRCHGSPSTKRKKKKKTTRQTGSNATGAKLCRKKLVRFAKVDIGQEIQDTWLSYQDLQTIRQSCVKTIRCLERLMSDVDGCDDGGGGGDESSDIISVILNDNHGADNLTNFCSRGLEKHMAYNRKILKQERKRSYQTVFAVQRLQYIKQITMSSVMADLYSACCSQDRIDARITALRDEAEMSSFLSNNERVGKVCYD